MRILISTSLFFFNKDSNKYTTLYNNIIKSLNILNDKYQTDVVVYHDDSVDNIIIDNLQKQKNVILVKKPKSNLRSGCFWRYECVHEFPQYDIYFFRDIDCGLETNDRIVIDTFVNSILTVFYLFVVHPKRKPYPNQGFLMGGLFGIKKSASTNFIQSLNEWLNNKQLHYYGSDEEFLAQYFYKKQKSLVFLEPRLNINNFKQSPDFFTSLNLDFDHETYMYLKNNYIKI